MTRVQLYVYDLSQGMAAMLSVQLTGQHIAGIWHTSVVAYGKETYFGQGIAVEYPESTPHGNLVERIDLGETEIPEEVFWEYIDSMRAEWTADKYHLFDNNCNSFSNEVCQFLVGKEIPKHITGLPKEFLATPFGRQLAPMIESMFGPSRIAAEHRPQNELFTSPAPTSTIPQHPHEKLSIPYLKGLSQTPILFTQSSDLDLIFGKLNRWVDESGIGVETKPVLEAVKNVLKQKYIGGTIKLEPLPSGWWDVFEKCTTTLKQEQVFPLIDVLRLLILDESVAKSLSSSTPSKLMSLVSRFQSAPHITPQTPLPKALYMMILRLCCNFFAHKDLISHSLALHLVLTGSTSPHRTVTTATLIDALLSPEESVRQCSSSLAFNMALEAALGRPTTGQDQVYEEWCLEMVAAIVQALDSEKSEEIALRLISALGHLLYKSPEEITALATVLGTADILKSKVTQFAAGNNSQRVVEIRYLVNEISLFLV
ncbi:UNVERIFIED_CONTAM: hypothetical protein HDU68_001596 [Siphonaria sp. JEL0065]|nr:hypothetical protein HDU68_001596 [Siphonaria sp. JEL0065]